MAEEVTEVMDIEVVPDVTATIEVTYPRDIDLDAIKEKLREGVKKLADQIGGVPYEGLYARVFPDHIIVWWERAGATYAEARVPFKIEGGKEKAPDPQEERRRRVRMSKREALTRIRRDVEIALRDQGYTGISKALSYIRPELETLAEEVARGRMSVEEAIRRAVGLAKTYATPPKPAPPRVPPKERVPPKPGRKFEYRGVVIYLDDIMQAWEDVLEKGLSQALREIAFGYLPKRGVEEFTKWWVAQVRVKEPKSFREWLFRNPPWDVLLWRALFTYGATGYFWTLVEDVYNKYEDQLLGLDVSTFDKFKQLIIEYLVNFRP